MVKHRHVAHGLGAARHVRRMTRARGHEVQDELNGRFGLRWSVLPRAVEARRIFRSNLTARGTKFLDIGDDGHNHNIYGDHNGV